MPRLAFRNDRTRVWTKDGRGRKKLKAWRNIAADGFYSSCIKCHRLYAIDDEAFVFKKAHKTLDSIPGLYCDGMPGEVGIWLEAGSYKVADINEILNISLRI